MANSSSVYNKSSRYLHGGDTEVGEIGLEWWDRRVMMTDSSDTFLTVDAFHSNRLDLIATAVYGEPRWWWILAQINNILDPQYEVVEGRILIIPSRDRITLMLNGKTGGFYSTREKNANFISPIIV